MIYVAICSIIIVILLIIFFGYYFILISKKNNQSPMDDELYKAQQQEAIEQKQFLQEQQKQIQTLLIENNALKDKIDKSLINNEKISDMILEFKTLTTKELQNLKDEETKLSISISSSLKDVTTSLSEEKQKSNFLTENYRNIAQSLSHVKDTVTNFQNKSLQDTNDLLKIFFDKKRRGTFGEVQLESILSNTFGDNNELWERQFVLKDNKRPDVVWKLHTDFDKLDYIAIDAKFPLENFQKYKETKDEINRQNYLKLFKNDIDTHVKKVKTYISLNNNVSQAFMFVPSESVYAELYTPEFNKLIYKAYTWNVFVVSPSTMVITIFWLQRLARQQRISKILDKNFKFIQEQIEKGQKASEKFFDLLSKGIDKSEKLTEHLKSTSTSANSIVNVFKQITSKTELLEKEQVKILELKLANKAKKPLITNNDLKGKEAINLPEINVKEKESDFKN